MEIKRIYADEFRQEKEQIEFLLHQAIPYSFPKANIDEEHYKNTIKKVQEHLEDNTAIVYVAIDNEMIEGWIWCHPIQRFNEKRIHVASFSVRKELRNKGIGSLLISKIEEYAIENGYVGIELLATNGNFSALSFYEKHGYGVERFILHKVI